MTLMTDGPSSLPAQEPSIDPVDQCLCGGATPAGIRPSVLDIRDLHKSFHRLEVLKGVSLAAGEHEVVAILGASGSGKSTFLRCVNLLETPDSGDILVEGEAITMRRRGGRNEPADARQVDRIRAKLGMVFQQFNLWQHMTVLQNVTAGPIHVLGLAKAEARDKAEAMLAKVGVADKRHAYPGQLSGGQQQRVAIARALAMDPAAMLFDEPTSALDPELVGEVLKVMRTLAAEGRTMLVVTHEIGFAREVASRAVFFHHGRIEEEGKPSDILARPRSERLRQFLSGGLK